MSKASVAQEPSMDEILASIRRIIETGEDRSVPGARTAPTEPGPEGAARQGSQLPRLSERFEARDILSYTRSINPVLTAAASDAGPALAARDPSQAPSTTPFEADEDRLTADLEQELAASWGHPEPAEAETPEPEAATLPSPTPLEEAAPMSDLPSFDRRLELPARDEAPSEASATDRTGFRPANSDRPAVQSDDPYEAVTLPLTSEATGSLVAASFNDLAQAIRSGELRSIEAMAQDMLRPMLQDWLDDNLPRIVERLVRDEIERMSRGGGNRR